MQSWHLHQAVLYLQAKKSPSKASASTSGGGVSPAEVTDFLSRMFEELLDEGGAVASMDACGTITTPLLPHQKEAAGLDGAAGKQQRAAAVLGAPQGEARNLPVDLLP